MVLGYLTELDLLPRIHEGDLRRALKKLALTIDVPTVLRPPEEHPSDVVVCWPPYRGAVVISPIERRNFQAVGGVTDAY